MENFKEVPAPTPGPDLDPTPDPDLCNLCFLGNFFGEKRFYFF
jgi:hypothetical protein